MLCVREGWVSTYEHIFNSLMLDGVAEMNLVILGTVCVESLMVTNGKAVHEIAMHPFEVPGEGNPSFIPLVKKERERESIGVCVVWFCVKYVSVCV